MIVYFILMCTTLFAGWIAVRSKKAAIKEYNLNNVGVYFIMIAITIIPCVLVSGLRGYHVGTDTSGTYYNIYLQVLSGKLSSVRDTGYLSFTYSTYLSIVSIRVTLSLDISLCIMLPLLW